jgi:hypothetical protein
LSRAEQLFNRDLRQKLDKVLIQERESLLEE